jgi:adhesin transport system membrane fusion protein
MNQADDMVLLDNGADSRALRMVQSSRWTTRFAWLMFACFGLGPFVVLFAPWTQNLPGQGRVIAYAPLERQQTIEAPIKGRIVEWWVQEGSRVKKGDPLLRISDIDPDLMNRLNQEKSAVEGKLEAYSQKVFSYEQQIRNLEATRDLAVTVAGLKVETARQKVRAAAESLAAREAALHAAEAQFTRKKNLLADGIVSQRQFEVAERDLEVARTSVNSAKATLQGNQNDLQGLEQDLERVRADAESKIDSSRASLNESKGQQEDARASMAKIEVSLSRQRSQLVEAPRAGSVFRLEANEGGEIVKAGDPLLVLVPDTQDRAVELWMDGNDAPLVSTGNSVRLQFEGWPAVQFAGWPAVAVGTFGGKVSFVDSTDDGKGRFRIVITPDPSDQPWPDVRFLRQGVRAKGWVLLNEVRVWYEIWRQLNGFPPVIADEEPKSGMGSKDSK